MPSQPIMNSAHLSQSYFKNTYTPEKSIFSIMQNEPAIVGNSYVNMNESVEYIGEDNSSVMYQDTTIKNQTTIDK